jgi:hypothetical protein
MIFEAKLDPAADTARAPAYWHRGLPAGRLCVSEH